MSERNYSKTLSEKITELRKKYNFTQEALADKLGITYQAVSKWENGLSCPDISLLPELAEIFGISIDELFNRKDAVESNFNVVENVPWKDDGKIRAVVYKGRKLMNEPVEEAGKFTFEYDGEVQDIVSYFPIICGDVQGDITAYTDVKCDDVGGSVTSGGNMSCGDVSETVTANGSVSCGDVQGGVSSNGSVSCGDVQGGVSSNGSVTCADVTGDIKTEGNVNCTEIKGNVTANILKCREVNGNISVTKLKDYDVE